MASEDDEIMREFLIESRDNLLALDGDFVALEQNPRDHALLSRIFRCVHTIKGTSGFLNLPRLEKLTHVGETQLSRLRDGEILLDKQGTSALLAMVDAVRRVLASLEHGSGEGAEDYTSIIAELSRIGQAAAAPAPAALAPTAAADLADAGPSANGPSVADTAIRVDVALLDRVMNLVGELVLARNQILLYGSSSEDAGFVNATQRLNLLTTELQAGVMKTRMQPISNVWNRFPRIVRDIANTCEKSVELALEGSGTDLDRSIIEAIRDPLMHAVRNAIDHGIESPQKRELAGKPAAGRLCLRAYHEGGQVNIEVSDDGGGINPDKVRARALERGLVSNERAARMNERELLQLIFLPGFSTADAVTHLSGRGVGMDVVKTNIEQLGGTVDVSSRLGIGTTLKLKIPLTLAIIPALVVTSGGEHFAIPQVNLLELVRLEGTESRRGIETLHGAPLYRLRGNLLPLVFLNEVLDLPGPGAHADVVNIVVLRADDRQFGLVVDGISDTQEIVVKPLGKELKGLDAFAGATIMGDGHVSLILDVLGIARRTGVAAPARERSGSGHRANPGSGAATRETLILFRVGNAPRMALPLSMVARLEEIEPAGVERAAGRDVVQYRGAILPLLFLEDEFSSAPRPARSEPLSVIVYAEGGRSIGLVVDAILDIVVERVELEHHAAGRGLLGAAVIQGRVTDLLDVRGVIRRYDPGFFERRGAAA